MTRTQKPAHRLPAQSATPLTANESAWIDFLRLLSCNTDPPPTLKAVQALRQALAS
jgi:hypothetical protein